MSRVLIDVTGIDALAFGDDVRELPLSPIYGKAH